MRSKMSERINCPFCNNEIDSDIVRCPFCNALFKEPNTNDIKFKEIGPFLTLEIITLGLFSTIWFFINSKVINKIAENKKDTIKLNWLFVLLGINFIVLIIYMYHNPALMFISTIIQCLIYVALTYRVLRIIQKYTFKTYGVSLDFNKFYLVIFNVFYLVHFIDTYKERVEQSHVYFDWKSPQGILLIILLLIIIFMFRFYYEVYSWIF